MDIIEFQKLFTDCELVGNKIVIKSNVAETLDFIRKNYKFDMLKEIIASDNQDGSFELIYHLYSTQDDEDMLISIRVGDETESVSKVFDSAIADEKEIYDLFGIKFFGNDELKHLYMPESWDGHPLRKDYKEADERLNWNE